MTDLRIAPSSSLALSRARLPRLAPWMVAVAVVAASLLVVMLTPVSLSVGVLLALVAFLAVISLWSGLVEGRRAAVNRLVTNLIWSAFGIVCIPLVWLLWSVVGKGTKSLNWTFLTSTMHNIQPDTIGGGLWHALVGTIIITLLASLMAIPVGLLCAVYLVEYGRTSRLARVVTILVDVMTGIPSIVAGLFALAVFTLLFGTGVKMAFGASVALALLMTPTIVRSTEEMLRLVPDDLREAAYALGVPKWRTITKVVLRTAVGGILTGIMLAVARVVGETAPILVVIGVTPNLNTDPFGGLMATLPTFILDQYRSASDVGYANAWAGALVLIGLVMILNLIARVIGKIFAPKTGR